MKDSQLPLQQSLKLSKYIKADNERFSTVMSSFGGER